MSDNSSNYLSNETNLQYVIKITYIFALIGTFANILFNIMNQETATASMIALGIGGAGAMFAILFTMMYLNITEGGFSTSGIPSPKVIIAFNSTIMFEAIASNRNLIIPNFNNENIKKEEFQYKIENKDYFVNSKSKLFKKINFYLNSKYKNRKLTNKEKKILDYFLGNSDGKSGKRVEKFLRKTIR